jgi:Zn ribbon nucleic-acid-binding protein
MPINRKLRGAIEFEPVIKLVMALDRKKKTLPAGSYCPGCGVRQELNKHKRESVGPVHFSKCSYLNYKIIEVEASLRDDLGMSA